MPMLTMLTELQTGEQVSLCVCTVSSKTRVEGGGGVKYNVLRHFHNKSNEHFFSRGDKSCV